MNKQTTMTRLMTVGLSTLISLLAASAYAGSQQNDTTQAIDRVAPTPKAERVLLLVSLGMPDLVLKQYFKQAALLHIPVVIRGLYPGNQANKQATQAAAGAGFSENESKSPTLTMNPQSVMHTVNRVKALTQKNDLGGVAIDPLPFRLFNVQAVPTLIVMAGGQDCLSEDFTGGTSATAGKTALRYCPPADFDRVDGNISIAQSLQIIATNSHSAIRREVATRLLGHWQALDWHESDGQRS